MHNGTLQNMAEHVKTYNFGSEGWGFESLQERILIEGTNSISHLSLVLEPPPLRKKIENRILNISQTAPAHIIATSDAVRRQHE
jgi:hypothetical protein